MRKRNRASFVPYRIGRNPGILSITGNHSPRNGGAMLLIVLLIVLAALLVDRNFDKQTLKYQEMEKAKLRARIRSLSYPTELDLEAVDKAMDSLEVEELIQEVN